MKIKINEKETYVIDLENDEELTGEQFLGLLERLNSIRKLLERDFFIQIGNIKKKVYRKKGVARAFNRSREEALKVLKIHYHGSKEDKSILGEIYNSEWGELSKGFSAMKKRWDIAPDEVGLIAFPKRSGSHFIQNLRIPNYNISKEKADLYSKKLKKEK